MKWRHGSEQLVIKMAVFNTLLLSLALGGVYAREIYVSYVNGHDSNSGSSDSPLQTVKASLLLIRNNNENNSIYLMCDGDHVVNETLKVDSTVGELTITSAPSCTDRAIVTGAMPVSDDNLFHLVLSKAPMV